MKLKSPSETPIHVALLSGRSVVIGPGGREVPEEFRAEAFMCGAIPMAEPRKIVSDAVEDEPVRARGNKRRGAESVQAASTLGVVHDVDESA